MNRWPSLKQLHYLVTLSECENFNRAAKACFVSQSTLSTGIQTLEELLGLQLIERDQKSFIMTPVGHEVVARARAMLTQARDMLELAQAQSGILSGTLRLGCIPTIAPFLLTDLVNRCARSAPQLELLLREDTSANLLAQLEAGTLDLLVLALPYEIGHFHKLVVGQDPFRLVVHRQLLQTRSAPLDYPDLPNGAIFLLEQEHCLTGHALAACHMTDRQKINPFAATSLYTLVQMVASRMGATYLPQMAICNGILRQTELEALPPVDGQAFRDIGLVWRPSSTRVATFYAFSELVSESLQHICKPKSDERCC